MKERIKELLINGHKPGDVASIVGCSPSYVSQLLKDADFKTSVETGLIERVETDSEEEEKDKRYDRLEHRIITSIGSDIESATFGEKLRALEVINKRSDYIAAAKRPMLPALPGMVQIVNIALPHHASKSIQAEVVLNSQSEIISIEGKPLAPMSSDGVKNIFASIALAETQKEIQRIEEEKKVMAEL